MFLISPDTSTKTPSIIESSPDLSRFDELDGASALVYRSGDIRDQAELALWRKALSGLRDAGVRLSILVDGVPERFEIDVAESIESLSLMKPSHKRRYLRETMALCRPKFAVTPKSTSVDLKKVALHHGVLLVGILDREFAAPDGSRRRRRVREKPRFVCRSWKLSAALGALPDLPLSLVQDLPRSGLRGLRLGARLVQSVWLGLRAQLRRWHFVEVPSLSAVLSSLPTVFGGARLVVFVQGDDCQALERGSWRGSFRRCSLALARWSDSYLVCQEPWIRDYLRDRMGAASIEVGQVGWNRSVSEGIHLRRWSLRRMNYLVYVADSGCPRSIDAVRAVIPDDLRLVVFCLGAVRPRLISSRNNMVMVAEQDREARRQLLSHAWVTVVEDTSDRGFQVVLDQMSAGQAVLVPDVARYAILGEHELLFDSPASLGERLESWRQQPAQLQRIRSRIRRLAETRFAVERLGSSMVEFIERVSGLPPQAKTAGEPKGSRKG